MTIDLDDPYLAAEVPELAPDDVDDLEDLDVEMEDEEVTPDVHRAVDREAGHDGTLPATVAHNRHREV